MLVCLYVDSQYACMLIMLGNVLYACMCIVQSVVLYIAASLFSCMQ